MAGISDFRTVVSTVLNNWIGLKMALENGMGGPPIVRRRKLLNLIDTVTDIITLHSKNTSSIEWESVADTLADFLDEQMDILFEDNSPDEVAVQIVDLYKLFTLPSHVELLNAINQMKYQSPLVSELHHVNVPVSEDEDSEMESDEPTTQEQADDGWTVVKRK